MILSDKQLLPHEIPKNNQKNSLLTILSDLNQNLAGGGKTKGPKLTILNHKTISLITSTTFFAEPPLLSIKVLNSVAVPLPTED